MTMKWCLFALSLLAVVVAVLYYYIDQEENNQKSLVEHLRPSFNKHYRLFKQDRNVNQVMRSVGVNPMNVHLGHSVPDAIVLKVEETENIVYTLTQYYSLSKVELRFQLGREFEETCIHNGIVVRSVITQYKNNLTHIQVREGVKYPMVTRRVFRPEELVVEISAGEVVSTLVYFPVYGGRKDLL